MDALAYELLMLLLLWVDLVELLLHLRLAHLRNHVLKTLGLVLGTLEEVEDALLGGLLDLLLVARLAVGEGCCCLLLKVGRHLLVLLQIDHLLVE